MVPKVYILGKRGGGIQEKTIRKKRKKKTGFFFHQTIHTFLCFLVGVVIKKKNRKKITLQVYGVECFDGQRKRGVEVGGGWPLG